MKKFWKWKNQAQTETAPAERILFLNGTIAEESWFDDDVTPQPVSYTHLDVYKRQAQGGGSMRVISREALQALRERYPKGARVELVQMDDPQAPVSYTHLDVYKRQL